MDILWPFTQTTMNTIELHNAYHFDCDNCGRQNFHLGVPVAFSADDVKSVADLCKIGENEIKSGIWHFKPAEVVCQHCQTRFAVAED